MPRRQSIPAYQLHKKSGLAKVRIQGKDHYVGTHGSPESKERYQDLVRKLQTDREREELARKAELSTSLSVAEMVTRYREYAETCYRKGGKITSEVPNIRIAVKQVREMFGFDLATSFGPKKLKQIRDKWVAAKLERKQINRRVHRVRRMFAWAVENELLPVGVYQALLTVKPLKKGRTPAPEARPRRPVPPEHVEAILPHVGRRIGAMIT